MESSLRRLAFSITKRLEKSQTPMRLQPFGTTPETTHPHFSLQNPSVPHPNTALIKTMKRFLITFSRLPLTFRGRFRSTLNPVARSPVVLPETKDDATVRWAT